MLAKRCIKFINNATNSSNNIVKTISNMGLYSSYSIMGANVRHLEALYSMQVSNVQKTWTAIGAALTDAIRLCTPIKGLIEIRDSYVAEHLGYSDCKIMIDYLCIPEYWNCIYMFGLLVNLESAICMTNKELLTYLLTYYQRNRMLCQLFSAIMNKRRHPNGPGDSQHAVHNIVHFI